MGVKYQSPFVVNPKKLTKNRPTMRQESILKWIAEYITDKDVAPSVREIGRAFNIKSTNGIIDHLRALERKGWIKRGEKGSIRTIRLTERAKIKFNIHRAQDKNLLISKLHSLVSEYPYNVDFSECTTAMDGAEMILGRVEALLEEYKDKKHER